MSVLRERCCSAVRYWLSKLNLDFKGLSVLMEAATGNYAMMPSVSNLAGAERIYLVARDSRYGSAQAAKEQTLSAARLVGADEAKFEFVLVSQMGEVADKVDLVLNGGNIRPISAGFLQRLKRGSCIGLMYEAWEFREADVDRATCNQLGIPIVGVDESHPDVEIFQAVGGLCLKMAFNAGYEVRHNRIVVWSSDNFGLEAEKAFTALGADVHITTDFDYLLSLAPSLDFVFICDYKEDRCFTDIDGFFNLSALHSKRPGLGVLHLFGRFDAQSHGNQGCFIYPSPLGAPRQMSLTLDALGPNISIGLHATGLAAVAAVHRGHFCPFAQLV
jgi:hypothetical protein